MRRKLLSTDSTVHMYGFFKQSSVYRRGSGKISKCNSFNMALTSFYRYYDDINILFQKFYYFFVNNSSGFSQAHCISFGSESRTAILLTVRGPATWP
jgi:hypothetical protein